MYSYITAIHFKFTAMVIMVASIRRYVNLIFVTDPKAICYSFAFPQIYLQLKCQCNARITIILNVIPA